MPSVFNNFFYPSTDIYSHLTRRSNLYYKTSAHTITRLFTITFTGVQTWNAIIPVIKQLPNLCPFKKGFRNFLINNNWDPPHPHPKCARTATRQNRAFSIVGPSVWNGLPSDLRSLPRDVSSSFYKLLKTLLFGRAWAGSASE